MDPTEACDNGCSPRCWKPASRRARPTTLSFSAILLSVLALLLEPDPLGNSALRQTNVPWIDLVQNVCLAVFAADFVLHLALVEKPRRYLFSFTGLIDASAVLFFFVPQVRSELLLWVLKFGRILRVFKLLKFIDEARVLGQALRGSARTIGVFLFFVFLLQVVLGYSIFVIESARPDSQFQTVSGVRHHQQQSAELVCSSCGRQGHRRDALHCDACGASLPSRA